MLLDRPLDADLTFMRQREHHVLSLKISLFKKWPLEGSWEVLTYRSITLLAMPINGAEIRFTCATPATELLRAQVD